MHEAVATASTDIDLTAGQEAEVPRFRKRPRRMIPAEGTDDLYSQSWFPICRSHEVVQGQVTGRPFLGGKVAIYRGDDGIARVVSSYCVHMGADLSYGKVVGDRLQCPFHQFEFGEGGRCVSTGVGAPPPPHAAIFAFPTAERYGLVWAFNGEEPLWELPQLQRGEDRLVIAERDPNFGCDPFVITGNTFDWHHFSMLHDFTDVDPMSLDDVKWNAFTCGYSFTGRHWQGEPVAYDIDVLGTNIYLQQGTLDGRWYATVFAGAIDGPGKFRSFMQLLVEPADDTPQAATAAHYLSETFADLEMRFAVQDEAVLQHIHFGPGVLLPDDRPFTMYLNYLRRYPRGNPARDYLR